MLKSNNTFLIVYGNGQFVKWKIFEKCGFLLEKQDKFDLQNICKIVEICLQKLKIKNSSKPNLSYITINYQNDNRKIRRKTFMNKKIIAIIIVIAIIIGIGVWYFFFYAKNNANTANEIIPEEEISEEQMRQTIVSLYFYNSEINSLVPEGRLIDAKELIENPYNKLIELLIQGPNNAELSKTIPEGTKVNKIELKGDILYIDFSKEFIDNHEGGEDKEKATIYSIVNTMTNLTEVNSVKILIDGEENKAFNDNKIKFNEPFVVIKAEDEEAQKDTKASE